MSKEVERLCNPGWEIGDPVVIDHKKSRYHGYAARVSGLNFGGKVCQVRLLRTAVSGQKNLIPIEENKLEKMDRRTDHPCLAPGLCQCWSCAEPCSSDICEECPEERPHTHDCEKYSRKET